MNVASGSTDQNPGKNATTNAGHRSGNGRSQRRYNGTNNDRDYRDFKGSTPEIGGVLATPVETMSQIV